MSCVAAVVDCPSALVMREYHARGLHLPEYYGSTGVMACLHVITQTDNGRKRASSRRQTAAAQSESGRARNKTFLVSV